MISAGGTTSGTSAITEVPYSFGKRFKPEIPEELAPRGSLGGYTEAGSLSRRPLDSTRRERDIIGL